MMYRLALLAGLAAVPAAAQNARVTIVPARPAPGSLVRVALNAPLSPSDSIIAVEGRMSGEPLHFVVTGPGAWRAIGAVAVSVADSVAATVITHRASGVADTSISWVRLPRPATPRRARQPRVLGVDARFTRPLDSATQARIDRENERAREIGRNAHATPRLWRTGFLLPRDAPVTSRFGTGRSFNGRVTSRHLGVDLRGGLGAPVRAANRGVVALVDDFFLAGGVVYIDHGAGIVTGYFHLSRATVSQGDTVARGQTIGSVGATGRVTGPHLHWTARYGALTVNPLDLVKLPSDW